MLLQFKVNTYSIINHKLFSFIDEVDFISTQIVETPREIRMCVYNSISFVSFKDGMDIEKHGNKKRYSRIFHNV